MTRYTLALLWIGLAACESKPPDLRPVWTLDLAMRLATVAGGHCKRVLDTSCVYGPEGSFEASVGPDKRFDYLSFSFTSPDFAAANAAIEGILITIIPRELMEGVRVRLRKPGSEKLSTPSISIETTTYQYEETVKASVTVFYRP